MQPAQIPLAQPQMMPPVSHNQMTQGDGQALLSDPTRSTGADIFQNMSSILVKQEFALKELCGIEAKNRYSVSPENNPSGTFLYAKEQSECCERICCSPCRALTLNIHQGNSEQGNIVLSFEKGTHCPMIPCPVLLAAHVWPVTIPWICCASKDLPTFTVRRGNTVIGSVIDPPWPLFCCNANAIIRDAAGHSLMQVGPVSLCTCSLICACCADMVVPVCTPDGSKQLATITRKALDCGECIGKYNRFVVEFGSVTDPDHRALLFAAAMMFDLQYWDAKDN